MARLETDINYIKEKIDDHNKKFDMFIEAIDHKYATKQELALVRESFTPTRMLVYGFVGLVLTTLITIGIVHFLKP